LAYRDDAGNYQWTGEFRVFTDNLDIPLRTCKPTTWFINSRSDLFHEEMPIEVIDRVYAVMALCPEHTFIIVSKRLDRAAEYYARWDECYDPTVLGDSCIGNLINGMHHTLMGDHGRYPGGKDKWSWIEDERDGEYRVTVPGYFDYHGTIEERDSLIPWPLPNVIIVASVENQATADERIPLLLSIPAAARVVSYEPALEGVDFKEWMPTWTCFSCGYRGESYDPTPELDDMVDMEHPDEVERCPNCGTHSGDGFGMAVNDPRETRLDGIIMGGESGTGARPMRPAWVRNTRDDCAAAGVDFYFKQMMQDGKLVVEPELDGVRHLELPWKTTAGGAE
jgi:protein gp37